MNIRYHVELSEAERCELTALVGGGKHYARKIKRAQILLAADSGRSDDDIAAAVAVGGSTVYRTKRRFVEGNLKAALNEERFISPGPRNLGGLLRQWWGALRTASARDLGATPLKVMAFWTA